MVENRDWDNMITHNGEMEGIGVFGGGFRNVTCNLKK